MTFCKRKLISHVVGNIVAAINDYVLQTCPMAQGIGLT